MFDFDKADKDTRMEMTELHCDSVLKEKSRDINLSKPNVYVMYQRV
jgi:hypothetical protein